MGEASGENKRENCETIFGRLGLISSYLQLAVCIALTLFVMVFILLLLLGSWLI